MAKELISLMLILAIGGCAGGPFKSEPAQTTTPPKSNPAGPAPAANPAAPPAYKDGYSDGCASTAGNRKRDEARYQSDKQYGLGWRDGFNLCRNR
ncbi:MAG: hypothetical protein ACRD8U_05795 [Pyrinomonadaceae bacterium]